MARFSADLQVRGRGRGTRAGRAGAIAWAQRVRLGVFEVVAVVQAKGSQNQADRSAAMLAASTTSHTILATRHRPQWMNTKSIGV